MNKLEKNAVFKLSLFSSSFISSTIASNYIMNSIKPHLKKETILKTIISFYLPGLFVQIGTASTEVFNPLFAASLGADIKMIGFIAAARGIGSILFDIPGGWIGNKLKEKYFLILSLTGMSLTALCKVYVNTPFQLLLCALGFGFFYSAWGVARLSYVRKRLPRNMRGRTLSGMGGIMRVSRIIFPVAGGYLIKYFGYGSIFILQSIVTGIAAISIIILYEDPPESHSVHSKSSYTLRQTLKGSFRTVVSAMIGISGLQLLRISRNLLIPLWANHLGISVTALGTLTGIGGLIETSMVVPAGIIIDRLGRKYSVVPCIAGLSVSLIFLPFSYNMASLGIIIILLSLANGIGCGINMTISTDLAPKHAAPQFLSLWRLITDTSQITGPAITGYIAHVTALSMTCPIIGGLGIVAAAVILFGMKETKQQAKPVR